MQGKRVRLTAFQKVSVIAQVIKKNPDRITSVEDIIYMTDYEYGISITRADVKEFAKHINNEDDIFDSAASKKWARSQFVSNLLFAKGQGLSRYSKA